RRVPPALGAACAGQRPAAETRCATWCWPGFSAHTNTTGSAALGRSASLRVAVPPPHPAAPTDTAPKIAATVLLPVSPDRYPRRSYDAPGGWRVRGAVQTS